MFGKYERVSCLVFQGLECFVFWLILYFLDSNKRVFNSQGMNTVNKARWFSPVLFLTIGLIFAAPSSCPAQDESDTGSLKELFEKNLSVQIKQQRVKSKELKKRGLVDDGGATDIDYDGFVYVLNFRNRSPVSFDDLNVECRFFYSEARSGASSAFDADTRLGDPVIKYKDEEITCSVKGKGRHEIETRAFILQSWLLPGGYYFSDGTPNKQECKDEGLWVRVTYTTPDGQKLQRDFYDSKSLPKKLTWEGKSI